MVCGLMEIVFYNFLHRQKQFKLRWIIIIPIVGIDDNVIYIIYLIFLNIHVANVQILQYFHEYFKGKEKPLDFAFSLPFHFVFVPFHFVSLNLTQKVHELFSI